jgi:hopanoid biosynthesis associated radical SAM protein HpnH
MGLPLAVTARIGAYTVKQHIKGGKYPLVLMLEPLLRCNLACPGCGKIDYPDPILNQRLSYQQCMDAIDECGAPAVSIAGGEPLLHREMPRIVEGYLAKKKLVILCTNALLLKKKIGDYKPHKFFTWSIHLDGDKAMHDHAVDQDGTYDVAVEAIELAKSRGFRVQVNCTVFDGADPARLAAFFDEMKRLDVEITLSPGYAYERASDKEHFLTREKTKSFFRDVFSRGDNAKAWTFTNSPLFLDFLAGNQSYECTPWSMPLRTVFGWQKPCYLVGEGYVKTFAELMEGTEWDQFGVGRYEKCSDCMVHCGFEGTAATDAIRHPLKMIAVGRKGVRTSGPMAQDLDLSRARPAEDVFSSHVERELALIAQREPGAGKRVVAAR